MDPESTRPMAMPGTCPKCGAVDPPVLWHRGNRWDNGVRRPWCDPYREQFSGEHLHASCARCRYEWPVPVLS